MANHGRPRRSPARLIAPVALVASLAAIALVVSNSTGNDDNGDGGGSATRTAEPRQSQQERQQRRPPQKTFYRVKLNDTLGLIAEQNGVPVEQIEALNPELDAQNLIVGQRIRLRE
jgi:LysM repeat protein